MGDPGSMGAFAGATGSLVSLGAYSRGRPALCGQSVSGATGRAPLSPLVVGLYVCWGYRFCCSVGSFAGCIFCSVVFSLHGVRGLLCARGCRLRVWGGGARTPALVGTGAFGTRRFAAGVRPSSVWSVWGALSGVWVVRARLVCASLREPVPATPCLVSSPRCEQTAFWCEFS